MANEEQGDTCPDCGGSHGYDSALRMAHENVHMMLGAHAAQKLGVIPVTHKDTGQRGHAIAVLLESSVLLLAVVLPTDSMQQWVPEGATDKDLRRVQIAEDGSVTTVQ